MGDNFISRIIVNAVSAPVANAVASAGGYAGTAVGGVGNAINGVGRGIEGSIRYYGDSVKDYGNGIQDWTKSGVPRQGTASNPLGLSGSPVAGKLAFTGGGKPKPAASKPAQKAVTGGPPQKALPAPARGPARAPAKPSAAPSVKPKTPTASGSKTASTGKKTISAESRPARAKPRTAAPKTSYGRDSAGAKNPLGI